VYIKCPTCGYNGNYPAGSEEYNCYNCGAGLPYAPIPPTLPTTQKAKGLVALAVHGNEFYPVNVLPIKGLIKVAEALPSWVTNLPAFARPCPPTPEHGFVESRVVSNVEELEALRLETLAAIPESEIMLTQKFANVYNNGLWTPTLFSVGIGHDGATAGKGAVSFPLVGKNPLQSALLEAASIPPEKAPYIETIATGIQPLYGPNVSTYLTQLRSGPILASGVDPDFVPEEMTVMEVIQTNGEDLLEWAKVVRKLKGKPGTVVYHPGGSLTDHYSVHCRENGVPIVLSFEPVIGLVLEPKPMPPLDPQALIAGLATGDRLDMGTEALREQWIIISLLALHNSAALRGTHSFWIGVGTAALIKLGCAAMHGEARHAHSVWKGLTKKPDIYAHYGKYSLSFHRARLSRLTQLLHFGFGDPDTAPVKSGCGFGGRRWALCGAALAPVFTSIKRLIDDPTEENASKLLLDYNVAVNQAHNGGWWLNKFVQAQAYDQIPKGHVGWIAKAAQAILTAGKLRASVDSGKFIKAVKMWPQETTISPLKFRKADLEIAPGAIYLKLKASTVPEQRVITIPATPGLMKSLIESVGTIDFSVPGEINLKVPDGSSISLWKETRLSAIDRAKEARKEA
jgi:hypothetical protein